MFLLTLQHQGGTRRIVEVLGRGVVSGEPSLVIRWGFAEYDLLLKTNRLVHAKTVRRITKTIPFWFAEDIDEALFIYGKLG